MASEDGLGSRRHIEAANTPFALFYSSWTTLRANPENRMK
jgi:hypothetical protein